MSSIWSIEIFLDDQVLIVKRCDKVIKKYSISSSKKGIGTQNNSFRTPTGRFRIKEKIGEGEPIGTMFQARVPIGIWDMNEISDRDLILTRILWLDGLDEGNQNTYERYIYIHGTNQEQSIGLSASHGCIRMKNDDIVELYQLIPEGTTLMIHPPTQASGSLIFFDCDSTLSTIEGIDELARAKGDAVYEQVVALTHAAMNGEVPIDEVFAKRMEIIQPDQQTALQVAQQYVETITEGIEKLIHELQASGWTVVILSGGFEPLIRPLAMHLGIEHVEAVPLYFDQNGNYAGYGKDYPTTRNFGKNEIIQEWKKALLPSRVIMVGDGNSDLETKPDVDTFIGYGGVIARPKVQQEAEVFITSFLDPVIQNILFFKQ